MRFLRRTIPQNSVPDDGISYEIPCLEDRIRRFRTEPFPSSDTNPPCDTRCVMSLFDHSPMSTALYELQTGELILCNPRFAQKYDFSKFTPADFRYGLLGGAAEWNRLLGQIGDGENSDFIPVLEYLPSGKKRWSLNQYAKIRWQKGLAVLVTSFDLKEIRFMEKNLSEYATTDLLTGAHNRKKGLEVMQQELAKLKDDETLVLSVAEIDNIKKVNEDFGRDVGDEYLEQITRILERFLPPKAFLFRSGGDSFAVLFPDSDLDEADRYAYTVTDYLYDRNLQSRNRPFPLRVTFGSMICKKDETRTPKQLLSAGELRKFRIRTVEADVTDAEQIKFT